MNNFKSFLLCLLVISLVSCKKNNENNLFLDKYILSVEVLNKQTGDIKVDNFAKQINIELIKGQDKSDVELMLVLADHVSMIFPTTNPATYNLNQQQTIKVAVSGQEISFSLKCKEIEDDSIEEFEGWTLDDSFGSLPEGISLYKSPVILEKKNAVAYIAVADINQGKNFDVLGEASGLKTPSQFYDNTNKKYPVVINGGYFWGSTNLSLICRGGEFISINNQVVTRKNAAGENASFYPTRGVFGHIKDNQYTVDWIFTTVTPGTTFAYPVPAPNKTGTNPQSVPSASFPVGAWEYKAKTAIGGGPVLVKNGELKNTWEAELFDADSGIGPNNNNPRTAIGITRSSKLILFVCEGRNQTPNTPGFTLKEVASIMMDLGCTEVLNLDGGGSTCMLVNGKEVIKPSDSGNKQRAVASAVVLK